MMRVGAISLSTRTCGRYNKYMQDLAIGAVRELSGLLGLQREQRIAVKIHVGTGFLDSFSIAQPTWIQSIRVP